MERSKAVGVQIAKLESIKSFFEELKEKKQQTYDSRSEKWRDGEKGEEWLCDIECFETTFDILEETFNTIDEAFEAK